MGVQHAFSEHIHAVQGSDSGEVNMCLDLDMYRPSVRIHRIQKLLGSFHYDHIICTDLSCLPQGSQTGRPLHLFKCARHLNENQADMVLVLKMMTKEIQLRMQTVSSNQAPQLPT